jgi:hypothetical protein
MRVYDWVWRNVAPPEANSGQVLEETVIAFFREVARCDSSCLLFEYQQLDRLISETTKQNSSIGYPLLPINS